jgi:hypothetical protein
MFVLLVLYTNVFFYCYLLFKTLFSHSEKIWLQIHSKLYIHFYFRLHYVTTYLTEISEGRKDLFCSQVQRFQPIVVVRAWQRSSHQVMEGAEGSGNVKELGQGTDPRHHSDLFPTQPHLPQCHHLSVVSSNFESISGWNHSLGQNSQDPLVSGNALTDTSDQDLPISYLGSDFSVNQGDFKFSNFRIYNLWNMPIKYI